METKNVIYYRITHSDGEFHISECINEIMSYIPKSYRRTNDVSKCNHLTWHFEKFEQEFDDDVDDVNVIEEYYFIGKSKNK